MLSDESRMRIFTGNANPDLAREIAENLGTTVGDAVPAALSLTIT